MIEITEKTAKTTKKKLTGMGENKGFCMERLRLRRDLAIEKRNSNKYETN